MQIPHDVLLALIPATIPTLVVLIGILLNVNGLNRLENLMGKFDDRFHANLIRVEDKLNPV